MNFGQALEAAKSGAKIYREGWNGKGQFVIKAGGYTVDEARPGSDYAKAGIVGEFTIQPHLDLKNAQGHMQPGWVPSMGDLFASDWCATPTSDLPPHQQRVHDEFAELNSRLDKLKAFVVGDVCKGIPGQDQELLEAQVHAMAAYSAVLEKRIERF